MGFPGLTWYIFALSEAASELARLRAELDATKAELARSQAVVSTSEAIISGLSPPSGLEGRRSGLPCRIFAAMRLQTGELEIARLKRDKYGRSAERTARLIDQLELQLEELECAASEEAIQAEKTTKVTSFERRKPVQKSSPEHLPRERVVVEAPTACSCCGSSPPAATSRRRSGLPCRIFEA